MNKTNAPTMKDVAAEAGVSLGTVSKVVNGIPVGDSYRQKVMKAIDKLHYQVNSYAQGLKASKTNTIALLMPNTYAPFFSSLVHHINQQLQQHGCKMLLCTTESDTELEQSYITMAQQNKVDGIIGLTYNPHLVINDSIPFVSIDRVLGPNFPCVACDNFAGGQLAAEKLAELGCKNVAFLRIGSSLNNEPNKRKSGFENGCTQKKLNYDMMILDDEEPISKFRDFLKEHKTADGFTLDGIFCVTDYIAYTVIKYLREMELRVPEDVQVIGFDGTLAFGETDYVCSTIVQPVEEIAATCVDLILHENIPTKPSLICLPVHFAYGGTTILK